MQKEKKRILIATNNLGKKEEYQTMLSPLGYAVLTPKDLGIVLDVDETGETYRENSYLKAAAFSKICPLPVIADDSGFEVEALNGFPGLKSARFCKGYGGDYEKAGLALNEKLGDNPNRNAKFHCCICYLETQEAKPLYFEGDFPGTILKESHGKAGFGYDPFFHSEELDLDMGICPEEKKNAYSHRGKALQKLLAYLDAE